MTPAEAHVWIAVYAAQVNDKTVCAGDVNQAIGYADAAVIALREDAPGRLAELDAALRQGPDIL